MTTMNCPFCDEPFGTKRALDGHKKACKKDHDAKARIDVKAAKAAAKSAAKKEVADAKAAVKVAAKTAKKEAAEAKAATRHTGKASAKEQKRLALERMKARVYLAICKLTLCKKDHPGVSHGEIQAELERSGMLGMNDEEFTEYEILIRKTIDEQAEAAAKRKSDKLAEASEDEE